MNAYERTLQADMAELSADDQIAALRVMTVTDIERDAVESWFRETELWYEGQRGFRGPVQRVFEDESEDKFDDDIEYLYATVFGKQKVEFLRTTVAHWAVRVAEIVETVMAVMDKPEAMQLAYRASFYQLGGGLQWPEIDAAGLAAAQTEYETTRVNEQRARDLRAYVAARTTIAYEHIASGAANSQADILGLFATEEIP